MIFIPRASGAEVNDKLDWWLFVCAADQLIGTKILSDQDFVNLAQNRLDGRQGEMPNKLANQSRFERGLKREPAMPSRTWRVCDVADKARTGPVIRLERTDLSYLNEFA